MKEFKGIIEINKVQYDLLTNSISKDETRPFMSHVWLDSEEKKLVSTDGRIMTVLNIEDSISLESGFFEPVKIGKTYKLIPVNFEGQFPNYKRIIPDLTDYAMVESFNNRFFGGNVDLEFTSNSKNNNAIMCRIIIETNLIIDLDYFKVLKNLGKLELYYVKGEEKSISISLPDDLGIYIIMPMAK